MPQKKIFHRNWVIVGAILIQCCLGIIYTWCVFTIPLREAGWTVAQTQDVLSLKTASLAISLLIAGRLLPKYGPRFISTVGGISLGMGYILGGLFGGTDFVSLLFFIGLLGGTGIGIAYVVPIAVGMKWFPDKKGFITGLSVAGFGFGSIFWANLADDWGHLLDTQGLSNTFIIYGILFTALILLGSRLMVFPPENWSPKGWENSRYKKSMKSCNTVHLTSLQMLATPDFYKIFFAYTCASSVGLMCAGLMKIFPISALTRNGVDFVEASAISGMAMAIFFSIANGLGRITWGLISDRYGRKPSLIIMLIIQGFTVIAFQEMARTPYLLFLGASMLGFNYGGNFALFPTMTADIFGEKYIGQNYGWVFLAFGLGGILGPKLGGILGDRGHLPWAFSICGVICFIAAALVTFVRNPTLKESFESA